MGKGSKRKRGNSGWSDRPKKENGAGEYPPAHTYESAAFDEYYRAQGLVPPAEWDEFKAALKRPLGIAFRIIGHADDPGAVALRASMEREFVGQMGALEVDGERVPPPEPIGWYPGRLAWRFNVSRAVLRGKGVARKDGAAAAADGDGTAAAAADGDGDGDAAEAAAAADGDGGAAAAAEDAAPAAAEEDASKATLGAFHRWLMAEVEAGNISRQEEVSMVPPRVLDVRPGHRVLDMCASPGSKTQQLIEGIAPPVVDAAAAASGFVIANDAEYRRCHLLTHQCKRLHSPALLVTHHDGTQLPSSFSTSGTPRAQHTHLRFDRVLCDVPCSGDGTLRKAPELWRRWSPRLGYGVHRVQLNLLLRGLQLLVAGGRLVYSTCSLNPIEDEAVVAHALLAFAKDEKYTTAAGEPAVRLLPSAGELLPGLKRTAGVSSWKVRHEGGAGDDGSAAGFVTTYDELPEDANAEGKIVPTMFAPPAADAAALHLDRCMRVLPHQQDTGGFFIAVFERLPTAADAAPADAAPAEAPAAAETPAEAPPDPPAAAEAEQATEKASAAAAHVGAALHLSPTNHGRYDALYRLTPAFAEQLAAFFGLGATFPRDQLVSRSKQGKSIFFVERALLQLLRADERTKLRIVNTGARVLERLETAGAAFGFRLAQEGLPCVLPHMTRQLCFASTADLRQLLRRRRVDALDFASSAMRAAVAAAQPGSLVVVHDPRGRGALVAGEPLPLAIAAMRSGGHAPRVDCLVKKAETNVMFLRLDADDAAARA